MVAAAQRLCMKERPRLERGHLVRFNAMCHDRPDWNLAPCGRVKWAGTLALPRVHADALAAAGFALAIEDNFEEK
jgi:hypothetical protein